MLNDILTTDWLEVGNVLMRGLLSLITLFLITKLLGKKQVSQLSLFDYVIGISIGNFAAEITTSVDVQIMNGIFAVLLFGFVAYAVSILTMKSITLRRFFMGVPTVIIQNGKIIEPNLKKVKFDVNDLLEECRNNGYFNLDEIEYGIMEANGKVSILVKGENKPLTIKDMNLKPEKQSLCANVIIDGKLMPKNLDNMHKDREWLDKELKVKGYKNYDDILLATLDINDKLIVYERNYNNRILDVLE
ncbi:MAG: DUF421 domain-containing protein [Bacilli bacterium]